MILKRSADTSRITLSTTQAIPRSRGAFPGASKLTLTRSNTVGLARFELATP
jgi:hypothetical protein